VVPFVTVMVDGLKPSAVISIVFSAARIGSSTASPGVGSPTAIVVSSSSTACSCTCGAQAVIRIATSIRIPICRMPLFIHDL